VNKRKQDSTPRILSQFSGHVEAIKCDLLDEMVKGLISDVLNISEEAIDRVSRRRSIRAAAEPNNSVVQSSCNRTDTADVLVLAMEKSTHHLWRFKISCSPRLCRGEHIELFEKLEGKVLKQPQRFHFHDIEERFYRRIILQGR